jgi:hypothetical protein
MFLKNYVILWFLAIILLLPENISAKEPDSDTTEIVAASYNNLSQSQDTVLNSHFEPTTSVFLELLGKSFYSFNVDFRKKETSSVSIGLTVGDGVIWPSVMYYRFAGVRKRFELGGGVSAVFPYDFNYLAGVSIHGVIGYRYQKKKGLLFRAGFTPQYAIGLTDTGRKMFVPLPGISFGYSF